ncbi:MAG: serine/threonine-protein kinase [Anaerolineae bacterium]
MLTIGTMLQNRYRIVSLLGQGGMGAVYRAWDTRLNIPAALKEMVPQPGLDSATLTQLRQQFRQEATVLARMSHPHLVRVTDFFEERGNAYLVMDFVEGENLADRIARLGALPEAEVLAWARQLLDSLAYCHSQGIIHRDVKPQNVIIRPDGQAMLVDFGLVKLWDPRDPRTRTAMRGMGTPEYAPPEQYEAEKGHTDPRSDVYSLGATLYHALAGQAPPTATLRMASPEQFVPVRRLNPRVRPETEMAVLRAMELARSRRFQSAGEMAAALGSYGLPASPQPTTPAMPRREKTKVMPGVQPVAPARRRVPVWVWVVGGAAVLLLLLCVATTWIGRGLIRQGEAMMTVTAQAEATFIAQVAQATSTAQVVQATVAAQAAQATSTAQVVQASATAQAGQATSTAQAVQATATVEAGMDATLRAASHWPIVLYDDFSAEVNDWPTGDYSDELVEGNRQITSGQYHWEAAALGGVVWWSIPEIASVSDLYLTVEAKRTSGNTDSQYGLLFRRVDRDNYYIFRIRDDGDYQFRTRYEGEWETLIDWTESDLIQPGGLNRLTVVAQGSHFTFYIDDQYVDEYDDSRLSSGRSGLLLGFNEAGDTAVFEFDDFELRAP